MARDTCMVLVGLCRNKFRTCTKYRNNWPKDIEYSYLGDSRNVLKCFSNYYYENLVVISRFGC